MRAAPVTQTTIAVALALPACAVAGTLATTSVAMPVFGVGFALVAAGWLAVRARGVLIGLLVLATMNAIPFVDVGPRNDLFVVALVGLLVVLRLTGGSHEPAGRWARACVIWSIALIGWWLLTWGRSVLLGEVAPSRAFFYGRDFLYFAMLLPLLVATIGRRDVTAILTTLAVGATFTALGHVAVMVSGAPVPALVHTPDVRIIDGVPRIYSVANDLVIALLPFALAAALLHRTPRIRTAGAVAATVAFAAVAFLQVRAVYGALAIALFVVTAIVVSRPTVEAASLRSAAAKLAVAVVIATAVLAFARPSALTGTVAATVSARAVSGITDVRADTGNTAYRERLASSMLRRLGPSWPVGLGFLHPQDRYFAGFPDGAIRNTDVGVTNALMTVGPVGAALLYVPVLATFAGLLATLTRPRRAEGQPWLAYGAAVWLLAVIISSITLVTLFSTSGLILTATLLAVALTAA